MGDAGTNWEKNNMTVKLLFIIFEYRNWYVNQC